ncbi:hypothetical protein GCM10011613_29950 [Cellvibrio zantedeschiae]|uniref:Uncharacterized protein n=1 Tax=Cellvibrio zantedeschiae TaxID=1237077 RepID=A0ABQ3BBM0_9GAMM|nr:hypothetical protein [Cellvibrio zantedeschiae]GGY83101.1 hypothetical protein GCM10011613_29950 [Cellvibrio zantedeschiae]
MKRKYNSKSEEAMERKIQTLNKKLKLILGIVFLAIVALAVYSVHLCESETSGNCRGMEKPFLYMLKSIAVIFK